MVFRFCNGDDWVFYCPMPTTVLYIATSMDGRVARADGALDWLTP